MADFMDLASRYATDRVNRAFKPFDDPTGYLEERFGVSDSGNVQPASDTVTPMNQPVVAAAPDNQYVEQAQDQLVAPNYQITLECSVSTDR
mgnify:CR=1 FL=1